MPRTKVVAYSLLEMNELMDPLKNVLIAGDDSR
jgi:hypothetical protein